ncbi:hypothetical protein [Lysinibacillus xylanilyticus]|uniref:hypothetical protein n=1 Tax=Lysinibacillus xylanilyticus TaxID=582475 RepID=UPI003802ABD9
MGISDAQFKQNILNGLNDQTIQTEKDEDKMRFSNETTKAAVGDLIKQAVDKKLIDKSWLDKFDKGELTSGDFEGLKIFIARRSN